MNMLIIGGAGFIGVNAAKYFVQQGWNVTVFDNLSRKGSALNLQLLRTYCPTVQFIQGDTRYDQQQLQSLAEAHDVVLHLAAQVAVTTSVVNPREDFDINALGTFNVLEAVRQSHRRPIVLFASTNKVYGGLEDLNVVEQEKRYAFEGIEGVTEDHPLDFHSPYGCSKGAADQYVRDYARIYGLKTVVFRQSCIYGPQQLGIEDQGWVAWFLIAGLLGNPITIYGNGKQVRDLLFVEDLVRAYDLAIAHIERSSGYVYNIGGGHANTLSLLEFLELLEHEFGIHLSHSFAATRPGDQPIFVSDNRLAHEQLGWQPSTDVQKGLGELLHWLQDHLSDIKPFYA